jgi:hypothetical protein
LVFAARIRAIHSLEAPMWGDSVQHAAIAQLLVDNGGLFNSWQPYAPYGTLTVHFGFSAAAALFAWVAGVSATQATLVVGQIINALAILALYPLAVRLAGGNRWAGVGALLAAGLLSPMPAFYVNWGRYAQLAGQAVLPASLWLLWEAAEAGRPDWKAIGLAGLALAGMMLNYYRMPFYYATFVLAWLLGWGLPRWRADVRRWLGGAARLLAVAGVALALLLPWGFRVSGARLADVVGAGVARGSPLERVLADYAAWQTLDTYVPPLLLVLSLAGLAWSLVRGRWVVAAAGLWVAGLASLVAAGLIRLPGANLMQNFAVLIALYMPAGLLAGWLIGSVAAAFESWGAALARPALAAAILASAGVAAWRQQRLVQPMTYAIVTRPDLRAMDWIRANTAPDARFLAEGFRIYEGQSAVGSDAGWWIPMLADRANTMPPQYALVNEAPIQPDYSRRVVELVASLETASPGSPEGVRLLCANGVTHIYVGQRQGLASVEKIQLFSPGELSASPAFRLVYHQDRVYIFALAPDECQATS